MAEKIKKISKFSEDALTLALKNMPEAERKYFTQGLTYLETELGVKEKKSPVSTKMNDETVFRNSIIPWIEKQVKEIQIKELENNECSVKVKFDFKTEFDGLTDSQWKTAHSEVVALETGLKSLTLIAQFSRGLLYITLSKKLKATGQSWRAFVNNELNVSPMTALRYMTLSSIIMNYPRLILCELSFTQILKHKTRLLKYLKSDEGHDLESALSLSIVMKAQDRPVLINRTILDVPAIKFPTDPDHIYRDAINKEETPEIANQWMTASCENEEVDLMSVMELCSLKLE